MDGRGPQYCGMSAEMEVLVGLLEQYATQDSPKILTIKF